MDSQQASLRESVEFRFNILHAFLRPPLPPSSNTVMCPQRSKTEVRAGQADPSFSSAVSRHGVSLSPGGDMRKGGERDGHLEEMAMPSSAIFFLTIGLWDGAAESVTV